MYQCHATLADDLLQNPDVDFHPVEKFTNYVCVAECHYATRKRLMFANITASFC